MKDIIYSKVSKSYNRLNKIEYLPLITICLIVVTGILTGFIMWYTQEPISIYLWIGIGVIIGIISEVITQHYLKILKSCHYNLFEYSKYYNRKQSVKTLKKQIRKNKKYLI